ncbi:MAG: trypsin-like peptidase domain-containing protein [Bacteroidota bacterium]
MNRYRLFLSAGIIFMGITSLIAQRQFPGKPMGETRQLKAADVMYVLPPVDPLEIESGKLRNQGSHKKPLQFALERPVSFSPESHGSWVTQAQHRVWRIHIVSPEAYSMGLVFNEFLLEPGVKLFVYDPDQSTIKGAFTSGNNKSSGILPVGHIEGDELIIEMQVPETMTDYGTLFIESVSHAFLDLKHISGTDQCGPGEFGCSQACEIDINCSEGDDWQLTKKSVVRVFTTTQYCSGVLVNNTAYDGTPYVLTAEHCINREHYADRSVFLFNYESPSCFGEDGSTSMSIAGCDSIVTGDSLDFSLVKLSITPPESYDVYYAGWDRSDLQTSGSATIHHPYGDVKKISFDFEIPSEPAQPGDVPYTDLDDYHYFSFWWIREWDIGSTEGGSSGAPLFNASKRVIGLMTGGIARCGDSIGYDSETDRIIYNKAFNYDDYYTKMSYAWNYYGEEGPSLKPWLDPLNTRERSIGGYYPTGMESTGIVRGTHFNLFPNPASDFINISSESLLGGFSSYQVFNLAGIMHLEGRLDRYGSGRVDTTPFAPGVYLIRFETDDYQEHHKFIVTR